MPERTVDSVDMDLPIVGEIPLLLLWDTGWVFENKLLFAIDGDSDGYVTTMVYDVLQDILHQTQVLSRGHFVEVEMLAHCHFYVTELFD